MKIVSLTIRVPRPRRETQAEMLRQQLTASASTTELRRRLAS